MTIVQYRRKFLKSIFCAPTDSMWRAKGEVIGTDGRLLNVRWSDGREGFVAPEAVQMIPTGYNDDSTSSVELTYNKINGIESGVK